MPKPLEGAEPDQFRSTAPQPSANSPLWFRKPELWIALGLFALGLALYSRSLGFDFVNFDDRTILLAHPELYNEQSLWASLRAIFFDAFPREEPLLLRDVSWAVDARLFGFENPFGYHLGNVLLNALNGVLAFWLLLRLWGNWRPAAACVAVFAVLTVRVEAVSWVMGRKDLLAAGLLMLALIGQSYELRATGARRAWLYAGTFLACLAAPLAKMSAIVGFAVLMLHRFFAPYLDGSRLPDAPLEAVRSLKRSCLPLLPHAFASVALFLWFRGVVASFGVIGWRGPGPLDPDHLATVAGFAPLVLGQYLKNMFWPAELSVSYRWPHVEIPLTGSEVGLACFITGSLALMVAYCLWRRRDLAFFPLAFLGLLVPYLNIVYVSIWVADRYVYLSSLFVVAGIGSLLFRWAASGRIPRIVSTSLASTFFLVSCAATWSHQDVWRNNDNLWSYEASRREPSLLSIQALGKSYLRRAEASRGGERHEWLRRTESLVASGFEREASLGRRPSPYKTPEQLHLARLHYLQGRIATLANAPFSEVVYHLEKAFSVAPDRASAMRLSEAYFRWGVDSADSDAQERVMRSFDYFVDYLRFSRTDPQRLQRGRRMLAANYEGRFPFLESAIRETKRELFGETSND